MTVTGRSVPEPSETDLQVLAFRYEAFISYNQKLDGLLARALADSLRRFARPWHRRAAVRVFRDEENLSADSALWSPILEALDDSAFFVLLASSQATASEGVNKEVAHWRRGRGSDRMLIVFTDGEEPFWDDARGDFRHGLLPPAASGAFAQRPRYVDMGWARTAEQLSLSDARFRENVADIAAKLRGVPKDQIHGEAVRQHRRTVRVVTGVILSLLALLIAAALAGLYARSQRDEARAQRAAAVEQQRVAESRLLSAQSAAMIGANPDGAALLSLAARRRAPTFEARVAMAAVVARRQELVFHGRPGKGSAFTFGPDATTGEGTAVDFGPKGMLVSAADDGSIRIWNTRSARSLGWINENARRSGVTVVAVRPDGSAIAAGDDDGAVRLWNATNRRPIGRPLVDHGPAISGLQFTPDGAHLVSLDVSGFLRRWSVGGHPTPGRSLRVAQSGGSLALGPRGETVVVAGLYDETVQIWDLRRSSPGPAVQTGGVSSVAYAPDGGTVATGDYGGTVRLWSAPSLQPLRPLHQENVQRGQPVPAVGFSADGSILAAGSVDGAIHLWDVASRRRLGPPMRGVGAVKALAFDAAGTSLASVHRDGAVRTWNLRERNQLDPLEGGRAATVTATALSSRGVLAIGTQRGSIWLSRSGGRTRTLRAHARDGKAIAALSFSPDGATLASAGTDHVVRRWDVARRRERAPLLVPGVRSVALGPRGGVLAALGSGPRVRLWDAATGRPLGYAPNFPGRPAGPRPLALSRDGRLLAMAGVQTVLWDLARRRRLGVLRSDARPRSKALPVGGTSIAFSPTGELLAVGDIFGDVRVWDVRTLRRSGATIPGPTYVMDVAFSPDGDVLAIAYRDKTIRLWDLTRRRRLAAPLLTSNIAQNVEFGGDLLAAGGGSAVLWQRPLWGAPEDIMVARLCRGYDEGWARAEWRRINPGVARERVC